MSEILSVKLDQRTAKDLDRLVRLSGVSRSDVVRLVIRRAAQAPSTLPLVEFEPQGILGRGGVSTAPAAVEVNGEREAA